MGQGDIATLIILTGGVLSVIGGFWLTKINNKENEKITLLAEKNTALAEKNTALAEENAALSLKAINQITGGDSWAYISCGMEKLNNSIHNIDSFWKINLVGDFPLYDVHLEVNEAIPSNIGFELKKIIEKEIGTLSHSPFPENIGVIHLPKNKKVFNLQVNIKARNGSITQNMTLYKLNSKEWVYSNKVTRYKPTNENNGYCIQHLLNKTSDNFPEEHLTWINRSL